MLAGQRGWWTRNPCKICGCWWRCWRPSTLWCRSICQCHFYVDQWHALVCTSWLILFIPFTLKSKPFRKTCPTIWSILLWIHPYYYYLAYQAIYATAQNHILTRVCRATLGHKKYNILSLNPFLREAKICKWGKWFWGRSYSWFGGSWVYKIPSHVLWFPVSWQCDWVMGIYFPLLTNNSEDFDVNDIRKNIEWTMVHCLSIFD